MIEFMRWAGSPRGSSGGRFSGNFVPVWLLLGALLKLSDGVCPMSAKERESELLLGCRLLVSLVVRHTMK